MEPASVLVSKGERASWTSSSGVRHVIPEWKPIEEPPLIPKAVWIAAPIVLLAAAGGYYWYTHREPEAPPPPVATAPPPPKPAVTEPSIKNPVPGAEGT